MTDDVMRLRDITPCQLFVQRISDKCTRFFKVRIALRCAS